MKIYAEKDAEDFLKKYVSVAGSVLAKKFSDAEKFSKKRKFPLVLKIISKDALHKSNIGGVKIVKTPEEMRKSFDELLKISKKKKIKIDGILVQEFIQGTETIIGIKKDPAFGHVIVFGIGGTLVEIIKDVSIRSCPVTLMDAEKMIDELKLKQILFGYRDKKKVNMNFLKKTIVSVSKIPEKNKKIKELDINPFIINEKSGKVADARIVFE